jgi:hypothetical protein
MFLLFSLVGFVGTSLGASAIAKFVNVATNLCIDHFIPGDM